MSKVKRGRTINSKDWAINGQFRSDRVRGDEKRMGGYFAEKIAIFPEKRDRGAGLRRPGNFIDDLDGVFPESGGKDK